MSSVDITTGRVQHGNQTYWLDSRGALVPAAAVRTVDQLQDELARGILAKALPVSAEVIRFRREALDQCDAFVELLEQQYQAKRGGKKGNLVFTSYDSTVKVEVAVAERIMFGPELEVAKNIIDECLLEWSAEGSVKIQAIVNQAFDVDKKGTVNRQALVNLRRLDFSDDERWQRAMKALTDSMRVESSKRYLRIYHRADAQAEWQAVSINVATA